ncbi:hypothetical protein [Streptomyces malaysiensis]|uniref:hypothetical protein n=1 Tax=Streptomyces malaysiensis TaxID=92644 RepID=UPI0036B0DFF9
MTMGIGSSVSSWMTAPDRPPSSSRARSATGVGAEMASHYSPTGKGSMSSVLGGAHGRVLVVVMVGSVHGVCLDRHIVSTWWAVKLH